MRPPAPQRFPWQISGSRGGPFFGRKRSVCSGIREREEERERAGRSLMSVAPAHSHVPPALVDACHDPCRAHTHASECVIITARTLGSALGHTRQSVWSSFQKEACANGGVGTESDARATSLGAIQEAFACCPSRGRRGHHRHGAMQQDPQVMSPMEVARVGGVSTRAAVEQVLDERDAQADSRLHVPPHHAALGPGVLG